MPKTEGLSGLTSDELKQQLAKEAMDLASVSHSTGEVDEKNPGEMAKEVENEEIAEEAEKKEEEVSEESSAETEETELETKESEGKQEEQSGNVYKIKYKGKIIEIPEEKVPQYLGKGYDYENKMRRIREEKEKIKEYVSQQQPTMQPVGTVPPTIPDLSIEKINQVFLEEFGKNPLGTLAQVTQYINAQREAQSQAERMAERNFQSEQAKSNWMWEHIKPRYQELREEGHDREKALALAKSEFLEEIFFTAQSAGRKEGEQKAKQKMKAQIPVGSRKGKATEPSMTLEDLGRMSSKELRLKLPKVRTPGF